MTLIGEIERAAVLQAAQLLLTHNLTIGDSGNVSARVSNPDGQPLLAITPHARFYDELTAEDIPVVDFEGEPIVGDALPSVELMLHVTIYQARPDVGGIIHAHPMWGSAAAVLGQPIPHILEDQGIYLGGEIVVSRYAPTGSDELAEYGVEALGERNACLLAHHGVLTVGKDPRSAMHHCQYLEKTALAFLCTTCTGQANPLPPEGIAATQAFFRARR